MKDSIRRTLRYGDARSHEGLVPKKRGPLAHKPDPRARRIEELEWDNEKLAHKLKQAELIIEVQKKVADLLKGSSGENS